MTHLISSFAWKKPTGYRYQRSHNPSFAASSRASQLGAARGYAAKKNVPLKMEFATFRSPPERLLSTRQAVNKPFACQARSPTCYTPSQKDATRRERSASALISAPTSPPLTSPPTVKSCFSRALFCSGRRCLLNPNEHPGRGSEFRGSAHTGMFYG